MFYFVEILSKNNFSIKVIRDQCQNSIRMDKQFIFVLEYNDLRHTKYTSYNVFSYRLTETFEKTLHLLYIIISFENLYSLVIFSMLLINFL